MLPWAQAVQEKQWTAAPSAAMNGDRIGANPIHDIPGEESMNKTGRRFCAILGLVLALAGPAAAQKAGGVMKIYFFDSPASMSIHEEATIAGQGPMMGVFNNLVMYDQAVPQTSLKSIVPDLATEWAWDEAGKGLTFKLRQGVK